MYALLSSLLIETNPNRPGCHPGHWRSLAGLVGRCHPSRRSLAVHSAGSFLGRRAHCASYDLLSAPACWPVTKCCVRSKAIWEAL